MTPQAAQDVSFAEECPTSWHDHWNLAGQPLRRQDIMWTFAGQFDQPTPASCESVPTKEFDRLYHTDPTVRIRAN